MLFKESIDGQPRVVDKVVYCKKCVVSNQRPRITFNEEGVCNACQNAYRKHHVINWKEREEMLLELLAKFRSKDGSYDCIVPASGGKDSGYVAYQLKYQYGMHPLTVTYAPFIYTDIGWRNYLAFKDSGFDNLLFFPNGKVHRKLARLCFELIGDAWQPFTYGQKAYPWQMAVKYQIPLIFHGENGEVEYGGSTKYWNKPYESDLSDWNDHHFRRADVDRVIEKGLEAGIFTKEEVNNNSFDHYRQPRRENVEKLGAQMHWFSFYKKWIPQENYYCAVEHTGFQANPERTEGTYSKYASLDDRLDGFHYYLGYIKFGIGRATSDAAHEIRDGHLTREEGVALVRRYDGEFPKKYFKDFLAYLNITEEECWEVIDFYRQRSAHLWERADGQWRLKYQVTDLTDTAPPHPISVSGSTR